MIAFSKEYRRVPVFEKIVKIDVLLKNNLCLSLLCREKLTLFYEFTYDLRHYAFSRQYRAQLSEDVYAFVLWRYVAVQIWRVKELFVPGIVASTINHSKECWIRFQT